MKKLLKSKKSRYVLLLLISIFLKSLLHKNSKELSEMHRLAVKEWEQF
ncbi:Uncharacterised protein [uncultured Eubacterium sp.]|nr:Uncharacterised protein [uncultured Eubacterium sp.]